MIETPLNERTVNAKMKRIDLCNLMLACTHIYYNEGRNPKWKRLHDQLKEIIDDFDSKQEL